MPGPPVSAASGQTTSPPQGQLPLGWSAQALGNAEIIAVSFVDDRYGWACSRRGADNTGVWRTGDGGASWKLASSAKFADIWFVDELVGWGLSPAPGPAAGLFRTSDGGLTWSRQRLTDAPETLYQVLFTDRRHGFIAAGQYGNDHGGWLLATSDGGTSWRSRKLTDVPLRAVHFINEKEGWAAGDQDVLHTADGGRTWVVQLHRGNGALAASEVWFADRLHGWLASELDGSILVTRDGGRTWRTSWRDSKTGIYAVRFVDGDGGWAVGIRYPNDDALDEQGEVAPDAMGLILETTDGGETWREHDVPQVPGIFDLAVVGQGNLVAVGQNAILGYANPSR